MVQQQQSLYITGTWIQRGMAPFPLWSAFNAVNIAAAFNYVVGRSLQINII